jgi:hypothetical protein
MNKTFEAPRPAAEIGQQSLSVQTDEKPTSPLSRGDFDSTDEYLRWLRFGGFELSAEELESFGDCPEANLARAVLGQTKRQHAQAWEGWGETEFIAGRDFRKAYNAVGFANQLGFVMNVHMTIVWETVGKKGDLEVAKAARRFLELFRKWCAERRLPCLWVHVLERGKRNGLHSHVLCHVPHLFGVRFRQWTDGAIKTVTGKLPARKARGQRKGTGQPYTINIEHRRDNDVRAQWELFKYPMKGVHPRLVLLDVSSRQAARPISEVAALRLRPQGIIKTKRVGTSRPLGEKAQTEAGFQSAFDRGAITPGQLYTDQYLRDAEHARLFPDGI